MDYTAFLSFVFVTTFTPGPNNILSASMGMRFGYRRTLFFISGVFVGFLLIMTSSVFFGKFIGSQSSSVMHYAGYAGAVYMVYLACRNLFSGSGELTDEDLLGFKSGFVLQFFNPKVIIYCLTVTAVFIMPHYSEAWISILISISLALATFIANSLWALFGSMFSRLLEVKKVRLAFNISMSLLLLYCAAAISGIL